MLGVTKIQFKSDRIAFLYEHIAKKSSYYKLEKYKYCVINYCIDRPTYQINVHT